MAFHSWNGIVNISQGCSSAYNVHYTHIRWSHESKWIFKYVFSITRSARKVRKQQYHYHIWMANIVFNLFSERERLWFGVPHTILSVPPLNVLRFIQLGLCELPCYEHEYTHRSVARAWNTSTGFVMENHITVHRWFGFVEWILSVTIHSIKPSNRVSNPDYIAMCVERFASKYVHFDRWETTGADEAFDVRGNTATACRKLSKTSTVNPESKRRATTVSFSATWFCLIHICVRHIHSSSNRIIWIDCKSVPHSPR